jgi:GNAT superfamily N-acetyltransferase
MNIVMLNPTSKEHTHIVLGMIINSDLDYGDLDTDARLLTWQQQQGTWATALNDYGEVVGIACIVSLSDIAGDALLWLEVLPAYRRQGYGRALLTWVYHHAQDALMIKSIPGATGFYEHVGNQEAFVLEAMAC